MASVTLYDHQMVTVRLQPKNKKGNDAPIDGVPFWSSSDPAVVEVVAAADGKSASLLAHGVGQAVVTVSFDADPGQGAVPVVGTIDVAVVIGLAVDPGFTIDQPEDQP